MWDERGQGRRGIFWDGMGGGRGWVVNGWNFPCSCLRRAYFRYFSIFEALLWGEGRRDVTGIFWDGMGEGWDG